MGFIVDFLKAIPLVAVLRERLAEAEKKISLLQSKNEVLELENKDLKLQLLQANAEIANLKKPSAQPRWGSKPRIKGRMEL